MRTFGAPASEIVETEIGHQSRLSRCPGRVPSRSPIAEEMSAALDALGAKVAEARLGNRSSFAVGMAAGRSVREVAPGDDRGAGGGEADAGDIGAGGVG